MAHRSASSPRSPSAVDSSEDDSSSSTESHRVADAANISIKIAWGIRGNELTFTVMNTMEIFDLYNILALHPAFPARAESQFTLNKVTPEGWDELIFGELRTFNVEDGDTLWASFLKTDIELRRKRLRSSFPRSTPELTLPATPDNM